MINEFAHWIPTKAGMTVMVRLPWERTLYACDWVALSVSDL